MKSMILDGILVQLDGMKCHAKILDPILRWEMVISVKKKKQNSKKVMDYYQKNIGATLKGLSLWKKEGQY